MATIRVPPNVTSVTFATSGVKIPDASFLVTGITAGEATDVTSPYSKGTGVWGVVSTAANGDVVCWMPASITSITIGGQVRAQANLQIPALSGAIATAFLQGISQRQAMFELVQG